MPSAIKTFKNRAARPRGMSVTKPQPTLAIKVADAVAATTTMTVTFDQVVNLHGVPAYTTDVVGATAIGAVQTGPTTIEITFSASVAVATELNIPYEERAVRNSSGGFVSTSTFPV